MWTRTPDGQWYLHIHAAEQPDLNWANEEVRQDFLTTLAFWADRGVAGFRIDVAHLLAKDLPEVLPAEVELAAAAPGRHPFIDRDEVHDVYAEWRALFDRYSPPRTAVAEAPRVPAPRARRRLALPHHLLGARARWHGRARQRAPGRRRHGAAGGRRLVPSGLSRQSCSRKARARA